MVSLTCSIPQQSDLTNLLRSTTSRLRTPSATGPPGLTGASLSKSCHKLSISHLASKTHRPSRPLSHSRTSPKAARTTSRRRSFQRHSHPVESPSIETASTQSDSTIRSYKLEIVQHPARAAEFGTSALSRLPLAPPLVAQLLVRDCAGRNVIDETELPFLVAHLSLFTGDGATPVDVVREGSSHAQPQRLLYGGLVSSPHILRSLQGKQGVYFMFPDVGIRWRGHFQLRVTLMKLPSCDIPRILGTSNPGVILAEASSLPFDVYPRRDYIAPAQTPLTQYFVQQGARMYAFTSPVQYYAGPPLSA